MEERGGDYGLEQVGLGWPRIDVTSYQTIFLYVMSRKMRMTPGEAGYFKARALGTSPRRLTTKIQPNKLQLNSSHTLPSGNIKATIWQNVSKNGPFFATTFSRPFKDQSGAWRNSTSFGLNDLEALLTVAHEAKQWIAAHVLKR